MFQNILESQEIEVGDAQLESIQTQLQESIEKAKKLALSCKVGRYQQNQFKVDATGDVIIPQYKPQINYNEQFWKKYLKNEINFAIIKELSEKLEQLQKDTKQIDALSQEYQKLHKIKNRKKNRRLNSQLLRSYECPYEDCYRVYGSDVSLNLHIKLKHSGGNKTDREQLAQEICLAQIKGLPLPQIRFNLPNNFLDDYRKTFLEKYQNIDDEQWLYQKKKHLLKLNHIDEFN